MGDGVGQLQVGQLIGEAIVGVDSVIHIVGVLGGDEEVHEGHAEVIVVEGAGVGLEEAVLDEDVEVELVGVVLLVVLDRLVQVPIRRYQQPLSHIIVHVWKLLEHLQERSLPPFFLTLLSCVLLLQLRDDQVSPPVFFLEVVLGLIVVDVVEEVGDAEDGVLTLLPLLLHLLLLLQLLPLFIHQLLNVLLVPPLQLCPLFLLHLLKQGHLDLVQPVSPRGSIAHPLLDLWLNRILVLFYVVVLLTKVQVKFELGDVH